MLAPPSASDLRLVVLRYQVVYRTERELAALDPRLRRVAVPLEAFARQLDALAAADLAVIDPGKLVGEPAPRPGVVLTFDGGHASQYAYALPLLIQRGLTAAFFVSRDRVGTGVHCDWSQLRDMTAQKMTIASAGCSGEPFDRLSPTEAAYEFRASRRVIEDATGKPVVQFAFPRGRFRRNQLALGAEAGYRMFHGTAVGAHRPAEIRQGGVLGRITIDVDTDPDAFVAFALAAPLQLLRGRLAAGRRRLVRIGARSLRAVAPWPWRWSGGGS
jgi:peptidoglycan/xylan/chitin deacetylase (PgdA/CDA1 family)